MTENEMNVEQARYNIDADYGHNTTIEATIDGVEMSVPLVEGNRHYDEIMKQVSAGTLTIQEAV